MDQKGIQKAGFVKVYRYPEAEPAEHMYIFIGEILRDTFRDLLSGLSPSLLPLLKKVIGKYITITVEDAKDKGILVLNGPQF